MQPADESCPTVVGTQSVASPLGTISMETNVQPSEQKQRIYTSTPKFKEPNKSGQSNNAIGLCSLAKETAKQYFCVDGANGVKGQESIINILKSVIKFIIPIIVYKTIILASEYIVVVYSIVKIA